jgi:hypothetical protein
MGYERGVDDSERPRESGGDLLLAEKVFIHSYPVWTCSKSHR